jgi:hypothetical protein
VCRVRENIDGGESRVVENPLASTNVPECIRVQKEVLTTEEQQRITEKKNGKRRGDEKPIVRLEQAGCLT